MTTEYRVVITRIERDVPFKNKEYQKTKAETDSAEAEYAYVYFDDTQDVSKEVFNQLVSDDLDVVSVINAVNKQRAK